MRRVSTGWFVAAAIALQVAILPAGAQTDTTLFAQANAHYAAGEFEEAARGYRQLLDTGFRSDAVHYNLGNALFKLGRIGPAILEYEKAAALAPNDPDVLANLEFLRTLTADKTTEAGARTTSFFVERLLSLTTLDQDAAILASIFLFMGALMAVRIVTAGPTLRRIALWGMAALAVPLALAAGGFGLKIYGASTVTHAIVLPTRLDVRSGPGDENTTLFTVHEGLKVRVRSAQGSWMQVSLDNGLSGWVPASSVGVI